MKPVQERIDQMKRAKKSVRPTDLDALLRDAGFERRSGKDNHWVYSHPRLANVLTIDPRSPLLPVYVTKAIKAIEESLASEEVDDDTDG